MEKLQIIVERTYDVTPDRLWEAITDPEQMKQWYLPVKEFRPEVGFETRFKQHSRGRLFPHVWKVTEVIPNQKISYDWRLEGFPGNSRVTFELTPDGDGTRIKVTHIGLETFGGDKDPVFSFQNFTEGWNSFIGNRLRSFLEMAPVH
jgi:uncharacterized protein YndB with AHSA1/START domain